MPIFSTPVYLTPPLKGFPLELGIGARGRKAPMMGLPDSQNVLDTILGVTDGQTDTFPKQRLRCAMRRAGKNVTPLADVQ